MSYSLSRCCQQSSTLQTICLSFNKITNAPSHRANDSVKLLQQEMPDFIGSDPVDYTVCGVMQQRVYECRMNSVDELKQRLVEVWKYAAERY